MQRDITKPPVQMAGGITQWVGATTCAIPHFSMRFAIGMLRVGAIIIPFSGYVGAFFDARLAT